VSASSLPLLWCHAEAISAQHLQRGLLHRSPRCPLPGGSRRARRGVLHTTRVERRAPATLVVLGQLQIVALPVHPDDDVADAAPRVEPAVERVELGHPRLKASEAEGHGEKRAAVVRGRLLSSSRARRSSASIGRGTPSLLPCPGG